MMAAINFNGADLIEEASEAEEVVEVGADLTIISSTSRKITNNKLIKGGLDRSCVLGLFQIAKFSILKLKL